MYASDNLIESIADLNGSALLKNYPRTIDLRYNKLRKVSIQRLTQSYNYSFVMNYNFYIKTLIDCCENNWFFICSLSSLMSNLSLKQPKVQVLITTCFLMKTGLLVIVQISRKSKDFSRIMLTSFEMRQIFSAKQTKVSELQLNRNNKNQE